MPCGVTKLTDAGTVTCDNAGTSSHTGRHSGLLPFTFRGWNLGSTRLYWFASNSSVGRENPIVRGQAY